MQTLAQQYMGNNAHSMEISKLMNVSENKSNFHTSNPQQMHKSVLDENNQTISSVRELFAEALSMFDDVQFNDSIVESTWFYIKADKSSTSDTFSFEKSSTTGMLWKIQDSYLSAKACTGTIVDFIPRPLNTWAKSVELSINGVAVTVTDTDNLKVSSMINILVEKKDMYFNLAGVTMGWLDMLGKRSHLHKITADDHINN